jgi:hypothetical protein
MPRRKEQKIEINCINQDLLRPSSHILNLHEASYKPAVKERHEKSCQKAAENIFLSYKNSDVENKRPGFFSRIRTKIKAKFYFVFLPSLYFEMRKIRMDGANRKKQSRAFSVLLAIWKTTRCVIEFPIFFVKSFIAIFGRSNNISEELISSPAANKIRNKFSIRQLRFREAVLAFVLAAFLLVAPLRVFLTYEGLLDIKDRVMGAGEAALGHFVAAVENPLSPNTEGFKRAAEELNFADNQISRVNFLIREVAGLIPEKGEQLKSGQILLKAGTEISEAGIIFGETFLSIKNTDNFAAKFSYLKQGMDQFIPRVVKVRELLNEVNEEILPAEVADKFAAIKTIINSANFSADEFSRISDVFLGILGAPEPKKYLLVFQNNSEIRPTGGFIGSFAEVEIKNGKIIKIFFPGGGSYDLDGGLITKVAPPEPLRLISSRWYFRDANWFPDFRATAEKIAWFYEKSGGSTVDGVIAINAPFAEKLLNFYGPVEMEKYGKILDGTNFIGEVQKSVELEYDKEENKPKQILADLMPILAEKIFSGGNIDDMLKLGQIFGESLEAKDILFYFKDEKMQSTVSNFGWSGEIKEQAGDYLAIFNTNVAGQKTDKVIDEIVTHETKIDDAGNVVDTVRVTRTHNGNKGEVFSGARNVNYVRVYVPRGSILLLAEGFSAPDPALFDTVEEGAELDADLAQNERIISIDQKSGTRITEEFGKTSFGNWTMVDPGKSITYTLTYRLPFNLSFRSMLSSGDWKTVVNAVMNKKFGADFATYNLFVQKQPGNSHTTFAHFTRLPGSMEAEWIYNENSGESAKNLKPLLTDKYYGEIIERK